MKRLGLVCGMVLSLAALRCEGSPVEAAVKGPEPHKTQKGLHAPQKPHVVPPPAWVLKQWPQWPWTPADAPGYPGDAWMVWHVEDV